MASKMGPERRGPGVRPNGSGWDGGAPSWDRSRAPVLTVHRGEGVCFAVHIHWEAEEREQRGRRRRVASQTQLQDCPARALFHALLPAAAVRAWVSLLGSAAARQRVSPWPPPPGDLGAATQDRAAQITRAARRLRRALRSRPRSPSRPRRGTATRPGARALRPAHTRAHAPGPRASRRRATTAPPPQAPGDRIPA